MYCTTDLCLSVNKLRKEKERENNVSIHRSVSTLCKLFQLTLSTVETENTYTPARLEALPTSSRSSIVTRASQDLKSKFPCDL